VTTHFSSWRRCLALVVATSIVAPAVVLVSPREAMAQGKTVREQLPPDAQKQWDIAVDLTKRGRWDGARTSFLAAYDISKNPRVLFNVAVCEKNDGKYARAVATFKRELAEGAGKLTADEERDVKAQITGLESYVAQLTIEVSEPGAEIFVNGTKVGVSPLSGPVAVEHGTQNILVTKAGFGDARETTTMNGGTSGKVSLKLLSSDRTSLVTVTVVGPPNAVVKVDGNERGTAPWKGQVAVSAQAHQFSAEAPGFVPATQAAVVKEGEALNLTLQLSQEQGQGRLVVTAKPDGATIEIDGKVVGSNRWEGPLEAKIHQIAVRKQGYYTWTYDVDVKRGAERTVNATLNEDRNTSFVPWLIGTVLVIGAGSVAAYFIAKPQDQEPVKGTLAPFAFGTTSARF